jgi:hypothetical protein
MKTYRKKDNPLIPHYQPPTLIIGTSMVMKSIHDQYTDTQMFAAGYYLDVAEQPTVLQKFTDEFIWDEENGTVVRGIEDKTPEEIFEQTYNVTEISTRQGDVMLETYHLYDAVQDVIATLPKIQQIEANRAASYRIDNPLLVSITQQAGITLTQLRIMFYEASYF